MSGFSAEWLALREPVDHRSRNAALARQLASHVAGEPRLAVVDLGCGTGANFRAIAPLLGPDQAWTLVDNDLGLLLHARRSIAAWADNTEEQGDEMAVHHGGKAFRVRFRAADLARGLDSAIPDGTALVTASAFFDLASPSFIAKFARVVAERRAAFHTVLTYNGVQRWTPEHPSDAEMTADFHLHQKTDKGFGSASGPDACRYLEQAFGEAGYRISEGDSHWRLGPEEAQLLRMLETGFRDAVRETGRIDPRTLAGWDAVRRTGAEVGHTDTLALLTA